MAKAKDQPVKLDKGRPVQSVVSMRKDNPWLASEDIAGHRPVVVIEDVREHVWCGRPEIGVYFAGKSKPLLLNATNRYTLSMRLKLGTNVEAWKGVRVRLEVVELGREFAGRTHGVRICHDEESRKLARTPKDAQHEESADA